MENEQKILIIEDNVEAADSMSDVLELEGYATIIAATESEARETFLENTDAIAIAMDGRIPGAHPHTGELVRFIRKSGFAEVVVAMSGEDDVNEQLVEAGCDYSFKKEQAAIELAKLLRKWAI